LHPVRKESSGVITSKPVMIMSNNDTFSANERALSHSLTGLFS
jgi:hypothetical protein